MKNALPNFNHNFSWNVQSSVDKRHFYLWLGVILANIGMYLITIIMNLYLSESSFNNALLAPITKDLSVLAFFFFLSTIPIWLSGTKFKLHNYFVFGIPIILLLPVPFAIFSYFTCNDPLCGFAFVAACFFVLLAVIFSLVYLIGIFFRKWNVKFSLFLVYIELVLLIGAIILIGYFAHLNSSLELLKNNEKVDFTKSIELCNSFPAKSPQNDSCWKQVIKINPGVDVCSFAKKEFSKNRCLWQMGILYQETDDCDSDSSYDKRYDPTEISRLRQCWEDKAKIYPGLDICNGQWTEEWNQEKCSIFLKILTQ